MKRPPRSAEEQAALDAALTTALAAAEEAREQRRQMAADFLRPRFRRETVAAVLGVGNATFANWQARSGLDLDAHTGRISTAWRAYSARDVVRLAIAVALRRNAFPADLVGAVVAQIEAVFPLLVPNPLMAANIPVSIAVLADGTVHGPEIGAAVSFEGVEEVSYLTLRMDRIIQATLEPLGYSIVNGNAEAHRAAIGRLEKASE